MPHHAIAQLTGSRSHQCDAAATWTDGSACAYVLLDGIGSSPTVRAWVCRFAEVLACEAAMRTDAEQGLRATHTLAAADRRRIVADGGDKVGAVAVVALIDGDALQVAWCGDARAYLLSPGQPLRRLTKDHNQRQVALDHGREPASNARNVVTSYLGQLTEYPIIGTDTLLLPGPNDRLLLASDGAYEPLEDAGLDLATYLQGPVEQAATILTTAAIDHADSRADNASALVADLSRVPVRTSRRATATGQR
ncbi:hypothetical protein AB0J43_00365 [Nonomuraea fuscirosea]